MNNEISDYHNPEEVPGLSLLTSRVRRFHDYLDEVLEKLEVPATAFDQPTENMEDALPLLYQNGYLTIKDYDRDIEAYTLSIPNQEVRVGYVRGLLPICAHTGEGLEQREPSSLFEWPSLDRARQSQVCRRPRRYGGVDALQDIRL